MGLKRFLTDLSGKSISQKVIRELDQSKEDYIPYRGGRLRRTEHGITLTFPPGNERSYTSDGSSCFMDYFA